MGNAYIPLFLDYKFEIPCTHGFTVGVNMKGRVLIEDDGQEQRVYGINPGGILARVPSSENITPALDAFSRKLRLVISDLSEEAESFDKFKTEMLATFSTNTPYCELWRKAIAAVRGGHLDVKNMKRENSETEPFLILKELDGAVPQSDRLTPEPKVAKAA